MDRHTSADEIQGWFAGRLAEGWFVGPPEVHVDREEILVIGELADVELGKDASDAARAAARQARTDAFREETRESRMRIADDAQHGFGRAVSWGVRIGGTERLFTTLALPVMTRLRMAERRTLDTLLAAGGGPGRRTGAAPRRQQGRSGAPARPEGSMRRRLLLLLGTKKGGFILDGDETRRARRGPGAACAGW